MFEPPLGMPAEAELPLGGISHCLKRGAWLSRLVATTERSTGDGILRVPQGRELVSVQAPATRKFKLS
jgi:hypothetical protein